ncbi:uncharacterized protein LOC114302231 [Camellia sinensis]|uniref:uncharacterized protein LOC114302231 n=1 Tax=Camellia sinensis TaxID=4442 RepID=UPI0010367B17|nr:uncharacterized protein LOC114302231 [Camellia sinensis]
MPKGVVKALVKIQSNFLWGGSDIKRSVHLVNWGEVTKSKNQGNLDVRDVGEVNDFWKDIVQLTTVNQPLGEFYGQNLKLSVGNGRRIQFWTDAWLNVRGLKEDYPRLYSLSTEKEESLQQISAKKSSLGVWQLQFRRTLLAWEEEKLQRLFELLESSPALRVETEDSCSWLASTSGQFSVFSVWSWWIAGKSYGMRVPAGVWVSLAPPKMQFFYWLAWRGRIKTSSFLHMIEVLPPNVETQCVFCQTEVESLEHMLLFCPQVWKCWAAMASWWDQSWVIAGSIEGLLQWWSGGKLKSWVFRAWQVVPSVVMWSVWKLRNDCLFKGVIPDFEGLCERMKL